MPDKAFLVDTTKCSGCRSCHVACKQWNNLPGEKTTFFGGTEYSNPAELSAITFNLVKFYPVEKKRSGNPVWPMMHKKCNHCTEANCLQACPEGAIYRKDGWVVINRDKCIGCGTCESVCVYNVPHVLTEDLREYGSGTKLVKDKSYKCHACTQNKRDVPACSFHCPTGALTYGDRDSLLLKAKDRVKQAKSRFPNAALYGDTQFGGLRVLTVLKDRPEKYGLPLNPERVDERKAEAVKDTYSLLASFTMGIPSLKRIAFKISRSVQGLS